MIISSKFKDKTYLVLGLGKTGIGAIKSLAKSGAEVFGWDDNPKQIEIAKGETDGLATFTHPKELNWQEIDAIVLSPGIPTSGENKHHVVSLAEALEKPMLSDIDLLYIANPHAKIIAITGTNGKSTTTALIGHILKTKYNNVFVGGNIGKSVLEFDEGDKNSIYVIEMSSFQLEISKYIKFDVSIFLNITPDHIDRHGSFENYFAAKAKIFELLKPEGLGIINIDFPELEILRASLINSIAFSTSDPNADTSFIDNNLNDLQKGFSEEIEDLTNLPGEHNKENILAAYSACEYLGIEPKQIIKAIKSFPGLDHRIKTIYKMGEVLFIDDSKATNAQSTENALKCFERIHWIVGGIAKEGGLDSINKEILFNVKTAYLIGSAENDFAKFMEANNIDYKRCGNLNRALEMVKNNLNEHDVVLLSPACASFDQFKNFEHRGQVFQKLVIEHFGQNETKQQSIA